MAKMLSPDRTIAVVSEFLVVNREIASVAVGVLGVFEMTSGLALILRKHILISATFLVLFLLVSLTIASGHVGAKACGCFGGLLEEEVDLLFFIRNILLLGACILILRLNKD